MTAGVHWLDALIVLAVWGSAWLVVIGGLAVADRLEARRERARVAGFDAHADEALAVVAARGRHPSSRWGAGPVPLEDSPEWGAR